MALIKATVHGAISIVNAIATGKGSTLGISPIVTAVLETSAGSGINLDFDGKKISSRLVTQTIEEIVTKKQLENTKLRISLDSEIPTGYGLKSSSAISSAVALACAKIFKSKIVDSEVLLAGVNASIKTKVSITGAYDDACGCYYGGFVVTDNYKRRLVHHKAAPKDLFAVIFIPKSRKRGDIKKLKTLDMVFEKAWIMAKNSDYWNAMILNGFATSSILNSDPKIIMNLMEAGAHGASVSGNGPSIAAVVKEKDVSKIVKVFSSLEGRTMTSQINNKKAEVHEM